VSYDFATFNFALITYCDFQLSDNGPTERIETRIYYDYFLFLFTFNGNNYNKTPV